MKRLDGKCALVTGGSRGIGGAITRRLAAEGARVGFTYLAREPEAQTLVGSIADAGGEAFAVRADCADPAALQAAVETGSSRLGGLDILVNNAGLAVTGPLEDYRAEDFDRQFGLNVRAVFLAVQAAARVMRDGGRIITIGSIIADLTLGPGSALYASSKSALGGLTRGLARDLGPRGITVNLVQPGPIDTERNRPDGPAGPIFHARMPIARHGKPEEVAGLVAYLASPEAGFVTGTTIAIDGGLSA